MTYKTIKQHEEIYWHIPKFAILPLLGFILFGLLAWGNLYLLNWQELSIVFNYDENNCSLTSHTIINIYPIVGEYILVSLALISLIASIKKGYKNLKKYNESGLIFGLIFGLIGGLIFGLIGGLIFGLIGGLIAGLTFGLIDGLIDGLIEEFK